MEVRLGRNAPVVLEVDLGGGHYGIIGLRVAEQDCDGNKKTDGLDGLKDRCSGGLFQDGNRGVSQRTRPVEGTQPGSAVTRSILSLASTSRSLSCTRK